MTAVKLLLATAALALTSSATAALCERPQAPSCATWFEQFSNRYDLDSCQRDLENFKDKVKKYADCVKDDAERLEKDVKKSAEDFQRRAAKGVSGQ